MLFFNDSTSTCTASPTYYTSKQSAFSLFLHSHHQFKLEILPPKPISQFFPKNCMLFSLGDGHLIRQDPHLHESPYRSLILQNSNTYSRACLEFSFLICGVALKSAFCFLPRVAGTSAVDLSPLTTDAASKLNVLGHDRHTLGVDGTKVGVLEQSNEVSLTGLLESHD